MNGGEKWPFYGSLSLLPAAAADSTLASPQRPGEGCARLAAHPGLQPTRRAICTAVLAEGA